MPLGFERLNERTKRPNELINFIKPLDGPDKGKAEEFLSRIAAQCYPVMKAAHISVMALEEFPPNKEFLGRNFNAGECIQLVLKDKQGRWLGFKFVQMVMMHELAHCKQMNHSRYFWQVRNGFANEMYALWAKSYYGEGMWGRGVDLATGGLVLHRDLEMGDVPEHLCGGTYRRRGRKRKRGDADGGEKQNLSYAERQQKRIAKKFGKHGDGNGLGEDELIRGALEQGRRHAGKPRVANSKRGRELRAQAALARFGAAKTPASDQPLIKEELEGGRVIKEEPESDSDGEWSATEFDPENERHADGEQRYVKVCGDETEADDGANNEMNELRNINSKRPSHSETSNRQTSDDHPEIQPSERGQDDGHEGSETESDPLPPTPNDDNNTNPQPAVQLPPTAPGNNSPEPQASDANVPDSSACPICSLDNPPSAHLCTACSHVLRPSLVRDTWRCGSDACKGSGYLNAGDAGRCGICGAVKPVPKVQSANIRPMGVVGADVLRWD